MREPILMPTLSDTMENGHLIRWLKQPGDRVEKGEAIAEVETDKAVMEVEAFYDGYLAGPLAAADTDLSVGTVIGYIVDSLSEEKDGVEHASPKPDKTPVIETPAASTATAPAQPPPVPAMVSPSAAKSDRPLAEPIPVSPYARGLARELGIDLARVAPGPDGSIRATQVLAVALGRPEPDLDDGPGYEVQALTPMQRAVANNMMAAAATPTFHVSARLSLEPLRDMAQRKNLSLTLLLTRACALAVEVHPRFNAVYTSQGLAQRQQIDIGVAVDVPKGLITPVLRDVARRPVEELAADWSDLKARAMGKVRSQGLKPQEYRGATFYLSNLGMFNLVSRFDAVLPLGASAILAVAAARESVAEFTLSCDHRVVYGADAARFLQTLGQLLGDPGSNDLAGIAQPASR